MNCLCCILSIQNQDMLQHKQNHFVKPIFAGALRYRCKAKNVPNEGGTWKWRSMLFFTQIFHQMFMIYKNSQVDTIKMLLCDFYVRVLNRMTNSFQHIFCKYFIRPSFQNITKHVESKKSYRQVVIINSHTMMVQYTQQTADSEQNAPRLVKRGVPDEDKIPPGQTTYCIAESTVSTYTDRP